MKILNSIFNKRILLMVFLFLLGSQGLIVAQSDTLKPIALFANFDLYTGFNKISDFNPFKETPDTRLMKSVAFLDLGVRYRLSSDWIIALTAGYGHVFGAHGDTLIHKTDYQYTRRFHDFRLYLYTSYGFSSKIAVYAFAGVNNLIERRIAFSVEKEFKSYFGYGFGIVYVMNILKNDHEIYIRYYTFGGNKFIGIGRIFN